MRTIPTVKELMELAKRDNKASGLILPACDYLSYYFSKPFLYLNLTPNQITVLWILIKLGAAAFMVTGNYWITVVSLFVFQVASILDGVDGVIEFEVYRIPVFDRRHGKRIAFPVLERDGRRGEIES